MNNYESFKDPKDLYDADERTRIMLDTSPFASHFWDENYKMVDCNLAAVRLFDLTSKEEYINRYFELTPEFQPDGQKSKEKLIKLIETTYQKGHHRYEWMRQKLDGTPVPVEMTMVCVELNGKNLIASYCRDLREQKQMMRDIEKRDSLLNVLNNLAVMLLTASSNEENFEELLVRGMELIGQCLDADCVQVWPNIEIDGILHFSLLYKWLSEAGKKAPDVPVGTAVPYPARWLDMFSRDESVNGPICSLPQDEQALFIPIGLTSTITIPLFFKDELWGIFCVDDCVKERYFTDDEIGLLRSASLMIVNAINRNLQDIEIQEENKRTQLLLDSSPYAAHFWDESHNMVDCNQAAVNLFDLTDKQEYIDKYFDLTPKYQPDGQRSKIKLGKLINETYEKGYNRSEWMRQKLNGESLPVEVTYVRVEYKGRNLIASYCRDLREHKKIMKDLESAQLTTSTMFEANPHINILFDNSFNVIDCNPAAIKFAGFDTKEAFLKGFVELISNSIPDFQSDGRKSVTINEKIAVAVKEGYTKFDTQLIMNGVRRDLDVEFRRIPYENSFAIVGYIFDMTEIRERENELARVNQEIIKERNKAEEANKAKSMFLSTMSHEIRTPMNAILGITEINLQNDNLDDSVKDSFEKIYVSGDLLLGIINDILDLSKIEAGKMELEEGRYEIASLVSDTAQLNMMRIGSKPIDFELTIDENINAYLWGDELRVKQILNNLLSNAFKYTAAGNVILSISTEPDEINNDGVILILNISDTGQGMTKVQVDSLFDEYARFNMATNRTTEGTGLGMSITRNLLRLMNGNISVKSEPGKGSVFTVRLPQGKSGDEILGKEIAENLHLFRTQSRAQMKRVQITRDSMPYGSVLIVDDVETNIFVAKGLLTPYDLKIDSVDSGFAAIKRIEDGNIYDIIFMDHMMPKMDGVEATKIIRENGYDHPVVALTANAVAGQADIFRKNGFDDFISKPIDIRQLNVILNKLIRDKQTPEVINEANMHARLKKQNANTPAQPDIIEFFIQDAIKTLKVLEEISVKNKYNNEDDIKTYIINVHGMKSALANIGKMDLSAIALKLEAAGRENNVDILTEETPAFINSLRRYVDMLTQSTKKVTVDPANEDKDYLREKLLIIKSACEEYDDEPADEALAELRKKEWSEKTGKLLSTISEQLLHSAFQNVIDMIDEVDLI